MSEISIYQAFVSGEKANLDEAIAVDNAFLEAQSMFGKPWEKAQESGEKENQEDSDIPTTPDADDVEDETEDRTESKDKGKRRKRENDQSDEIGTDADV